MLPNSAPMLFDPADPQDPAPAPEVISDAVRRRVLSEAADASECKPEPTEADRQLAEALRNKMASILATPQLRPRDLFALEQTARIGRELLAIGTDPTARVRRRGGNVMSNYSEIMGEEGAFLNGDNISALVGAPAHETFGASALREIVGVAKALIEKKTAEDGFDLQREIKSLMAARDAGLTALATRLEKRIEEHTKDESEPAAPPAAAAPETQLGEAASVGWRAYDRDVTTAPPASVTAPVAPTIASAEAAS